MLKRFIILLFVLLLASCGGGKKAPDPQPSLTPEPRSTFKQFHDLSEQIYDGDGSWGRTAYGYRMGLRDSYWRADVYGILAERGHAQAALFSDRAGQVADYLLRVQSEGGTGVFGFPADTNNPEFGDKVAQVMAACGECIHSGWVVSLPGGDIAELYYDHGYALVSLARAYSHHPSQALLQAIREGADWILDKPMTSNLNYLSALSKGLCYAYELTDEAAYLDKAVELHELGIFPNLSQGQANDTHNAQLEYHGFIVSGIIALRRVLPESHRLSDELDRQLSAALAAMAKRNFNQSGAYGETWPGTNLFAWYELEELRTLSPSEQNAVNRIIALIDGYADDVEDEPQAYRLRKALYSYFALGLYDE